MFDAANRLTALGADSYTYDANGNQTGKTSGGVTTTYSYDALDRLTGISGPVTASYSYNGDGLRVSKTVGGTTTTYTWDVLGLPVVLADGTEYVWGQGLISQITSSSAATYAHADGLGSIRLLTDSAGTVVGTQQYDAFGAARSQSGVQLAFGYTGEQVDAESGLVYLRARYMDLATGRLLTHDPVPGYAADPASHQAYVYVRNNPVRWRDPTGREPVGDWEQGGGGPGSAGGLSPIDMPFWGIGAAPGGGKPPKGGGGPGASSRLPARSLTAPNSLRGASPQEIEALIPPNWIREPTSGGGGTVWREIRPGSKPANRRFTGNQVRIMPGDPTAPDPLHQGPYVVVNIKGQGPIRIPLAGNPALSAAVAALGGLGGPGDGIPGAGGGSSADCEFAP